MTNPINTVGFNTETELFGSNELPRGKSVVKRYSGSNYVAGATGAPASTGRVQRQIGSTKKDFVPETREVTTSEDPAPVERDVFAGTYGTTRAARVLHQYDIDFWGSTGVMGYATKSTQPQMSEDEVTQKYNDFVAFSYLPQTLLPSKELFRDLVNPQSRTAAMPALLLAAGVITSPTNTTGLIGQTDLGGVEDLPTVPPPFASNLQSSCGADSYFARSSGPVYTNERPLA
jgi:hypothetical protein